MSLHDIPKGLLRRGVNITLSEVAVEVLEEHFTFVEEFREFRRLVRRIEPKLRSGETKEQIGLSFNLAEEIEFRLRGYLGETNPDPLYQMALADLPKQYPRFMREIGRI